MSYDEWLRTVPIEITGDPLWKLEVYRLALFVTDLGWHDVTKLTGDRGTFGVSDQLYRALASVCANIAEGYSHGTGRNRARFYEYALGSCRESRGWYYQERHVLGESVTTHRLELTTRIIKILMVMIPDQRGQYIKEESVGYGASN